jgi:hypothetical protein
VPDTDTFISYLVNNVGLGTGNLTLPHATVSGRRLLAIPANSSSAASRLLLTAQSGDTIFGTGVAAGQTTFLAPGPVLMFSDGNHRWFIVAFQ